MKDDTRRKCCNNNNNMGEVDFTDEIVSLYDFDKKYKKW